MPPADAGHDPVLMNEVLDALALEPGQAIIDCTLGRAGHARAIGERLGKDGLLVGLDVDPRNLAFANERLKGLDCTVRLFEANFAQIDEVAQNLDRRAVDGVLADLGLSPSGSESAPLQPPDSKA